MKYVLDERRGDRCTDCTVVSVSSVRGPKYCISFSSFIIFQRTFIKHISKREREKRGGGGHRNDRMQQRLLFQSVVS
jgi:hypothetical protein